MTKIKNPCDTCSHAKICKDADSMACVVLFLNEQRGTYAQVMMDRLPISMNIRCENWEKVTVTEKRLTI